MERFVKIRVSGLGVTRSALDLGEIRGFSLFRHSLRLSLWVISGARKLQALLFFYLN